MQASQRAARRGAEGQRARIVGRARPAASARRSIVGEVALSVVLLVGSSLLLVSFLQLQRTHPGFEAKGAASGVRRRADQPVHDDRAAGRSSSRRSSSSCARSAGVTDAAVAIGLPLSGFNPRSPYSVGGRPILPLPQRPIANLGIVSEGYFRLMRITLAAGRAVHGGRSRRRARRLHHQRVVRAATLPRRVGARPYAAARPRCRDHRRDRRRHSRRQDQRPQRPDAGRDLLPDAPARAARAWRLSARVDGDPASLQSAIRAAVTAVDKNQPISFFATLETNISQSLGAQRIVASLTADLRWPGAGAVRRWVSIRSSPTRCRSGDPKSASGWHSARSAGRW